MLEYTYLKHHSLAKGTEAANLKNEQVYVKQKNNYFLKETFRFFIP